MTTPPVRILLEAWIDNEGRLIMCSYDGSKFYAMNLSSQYARTLKRRSKKLESIEL
jgi:hypothetical protein